MKISIDKQQDCCVIAVMGRLDTVTAPDFENECAACGEGEEKQIILDFSALDYISSAGLRCVLAMAKKLKKREGRVVLCGLKGLVEEVIKVSGFDSILPVFATVEQAVKGEA